MSSLLAKKLDILKFNNIKLRVVCAGLGVKIDTKVRNIWLHNQNKLSNSYIYLTKTLIQLGRNNHQRTTQLHQLEARETRGIQECCRNDACEIAEIERIV